MNGDPPFRHGDQPCHGCQSCFAEVCDVDSAPDFLPDTAILGRECHGEEWAGLDG